MTAWLHTAIIIFLVVIFPPVDRRLSKKATRMQIYASAMIVSWSVALLLLATTPLRDIWYAPPIPLRVPAWLLIEVIVVLLIVNVISVLRPPPLQRIEFLLPRSRNERIVFALTAISAGICEEIIYRGFMIRYFEQWGGLTIAIIAAALAFSLAHVYQGLPGAISTLFFGLIFTLLFFIAGSLWLPMIFHALGDLRLLAQGRSNFPPGGL